MKHHLGKFFLVPLSLKKNLIRASQTPEFVRICGVGGGGGVDSTPNFEPILWRIRLFSSQSVECLLICHLLPKHVYHHQLIIAGTKQLPKHQLQTTQRIKTDNKLLDILSVRPRDKSLPSTTETLVTITVNASHNHGPMFYNCFFLLTDRTREFDWCSRNFSNGDYLLPFP